MGIKSDLTLINKGTLITEDENYQLVLLAYIVKKYAINMDNKFENSLSFVSYLKENVEKLSLSKNEVNLFNEVLSNLTQKLLHDDSIYKAIQKLSNNYDKEAFIEYVSELGNTSYRRCVSASPSLIDLSLNILNCKKGSKLLDINTGTGDFLVSAINNYKDVFIAGYERNINNSIDLRIRMLLLNNNCDFKYGSFLNEEDDDFYDGIIAIPPFGERISGVISKNIDYKGNNSLWYYIDRIINRIGTKGKAIVITPSGSLFKKPEMNIREYLIKNKLLEAIIELPTNLFTGTAVATTMLVISRNNHYTRIIDATKYSEKGIKTNILNVSEIMKLYNSDSSDSKTITDVEFKEKDYSFIPSAYLRNVADKMKNPVILNDYVEVIRGYRGTTTNVKDKKCKYIILKSITNGLLDKSNIETIDYEDNMDKYILQDKDVVVTARGSRFESSVVRIEDNEKIICGENFYILRINNKQLNPYYLSSFLNSEIGQESLFSNTMKTLMLIVRSEDLINLKIDLKPIEEQQKIEELLVEKEKLYFDYNNKMKKIVDKINKVIR